MTDGPYGAGIHWAGVDIPGRTGYYVYKDGVQVADVTASQYMFHGVTAGTSFAVGVRAHDSGGGTSSLATITYVAPSGIPPGFPVGISSNDRYLVLNDGSTPFLVVGDSSQTLTLNVPVTGANSADTYLANRQAKGFTTIQAYLLTTSYSAGRDNGSTYDGILPFSSSWDFATPNATFFQRAHDVIALALSYGMLIWLDPCDTGGNGLANIEANGPTKCRTFGQYLGNFFKDLPNIVWSSGSDYQNWSTDGNADPSVTAIAQGIHDTYPAALQTVQLNYLVSASRDDSAWDSIANVDDVYTYDATYYKLLSEYNLNPAIPTMMIEATYEGETGHGISGTVPRHMRWQAYWSHLSGATGQVFGNQNVWRMNASWPTSLNTTGANDMGRLADLFQSLAWWKLVPDQGNTFVTAGKGTYSTTGYSYATCALAADGTLGMAYCPAATTLTVDLTKIVGSFTARWYDPTNGAFQTASHGGTLSAATFATPGNNNAGDPDWVLVFEETTGLLPLADPTFVANSNPLGGNNDGSGIANRATPDQIMSLVVDPNGYAIGGVAYTETYLMPHLYDTAGNQRGCVLDGGCANGPKTQVIPHEKNGLGVQYAVSDGTKIYGVTGTDIMWWPIATLLAGSGNNNVYITPGIYRLLDVTMTLNATITAGNTYTQIAVQSVPTDIPTGAHLCTFASRSDDWTVTGDVAATGSATTIPVTSRAASYSYVSGTDSVAVARRFTALAIRSTNLYAAETGPYGMDDGSGGKLAPAGTTVYQIPTSQFTAGQNTTQTLTTTGSWVIPNCRYLTVDRQGNLWALQQASEDDSRAAILSRWQVTGSGGTFAATRIGAFTLSSAVYPLGMCCDPNSDTIVVSDNSQDQNFKKYTYTGFSEGNPVLTADGTIGVQYGYLDDTTGTPGELGTRRFCGPRDISIDDTGNIYTAESFYPGGGDNCFSNLGTHVPVGCIVTKQTASGTQVWRHYSTVIGDVGSPTPDGDRFYDCTMIYDRRNNDTSPPLWSTYAGVNSQYILKSYSVDPFTYTDRRAAQNVAAGGRPWIVDTNGQRYLTMPASDFARAEIYQMIGDIARPCVTFAPPTATIDPGQAGSSTFSIPNLNGVWMIDDSLSVWFMPRAQGTFYRWRLVGYNSNQTPLYDNTHRDAWSIPAAYNDVRQLIVRGDDIWTCGFAAGDAATLKVSWKCAGLTLRKYAGAVSQLTANGTWPTETWAFTISFTSSDEAVSTHYPIAIEASPDDNRVIVAWLKGSPSMDGALTFIDDTTGTQSSYRDTPTPSFGQNGRVDYFQGIVARNGYVWVEEDWGDKCFGIDLTGT